MTDARDRQVTSLGSAQPRTGRGALRRARRRARGLFWAVGIFSICMNVLMLTGPVYMLQVYDRVLTSRSEETLVALSLLATFMFAAMGCLDYVRALVLARIGLRFQGDLEGRVFDAALMQTAQGRAEHPDPIGDLDAVQAAFASPVIPALFDLPFAPLFLALIFAFHPLLGTAAVSGGAILVLFSLANHLGTRGALRTARLAGGKAKSWGDTVLDQAETAAGLGMRRTSFERWRGFRDRAAKATCRTADRAMGFTASGRTWRHFLQSAMLGLGAWLVLHDALTAGTMIAASILLGRALAPVETLIAYWPVITRALAGWQALAALLDKPPQAATPLTLPRPEARLDVEQLTVIPPGQSKATLRLVSFSLAPGQALGVIGPSGAGKSTLARALTGIIKPAGGRVTLGRAALDHYSDESLAKHIGWLPQTVRLFDGTIAENIARFDPAAKDEDIISAAQKAAAHDLILSLPNGYDTPITHGGAPLSGGQLQRVGLARALYGDPVLLVLDEPNSNLDHDGSEALNHAIRVLKRERKAVMIMAHRPAAIQECDLLLMLDGGMRRAFGPKEDVFRDMVANHADITGPSSATLGTA